MSRLTWARARALLDEHSAGDVLRPAGGVVLPWMGAPVCADWPARLIADHLARLQGGPAWRAYRDAVSAAIADGALPALRCETIVAMTLQAPTGRLIERGTSAYIGMAADAPDFAAWLRAQRETPSEHIAAWVEATAPAPAAALPKPSQAAAKADRERTRLEFCESEGIVFDEQPLRPLPYGIGAAAKKLGITRQSLSTDVKAALKQRFEANRNGRA